MTDEELLAEVARLRELTKKATLGPWTAVHESVLGTIGTPVLMMYDDVATAHPSALVVGMASDYGEGAAAGDDAAFLAAARAAVPALCDAVERLVDERNTARAALAIAKAAGRQEDPDPS